MSKLEIPATLDHLERVFAFIHDGIKGESLNEKIRKKLDVAVEEIFTNIATYAYDPETGPAKIVLEILEHPLRVEIIFSDQGKPYNPLLQEEVDIMKKMEDREEGGLGLYLVRKYMDDISYEYKDGQNVVKITKLLEKKEISDDDLHE